jgi:hypothetical protein
MKQEPTNAEIYEKLGRIEARVEDRLVQIYEQVKATNGRVTKLEKWKDRLDIIAEYTKENKKGETVVDWQKLMLYALGLVATALAVISYLVKK